MLKILADTLEQLDLAADHIAKGDPNNARFGLMLTDNALELTLHNVASNDAGALKSYPQGRGSQNPEALEKAQGQDFRRKIAYGVLIKMFDAAVADTLKIGHSFRNELYHAGIRHESILLELAKFHFHTVCAVLSRHQPEWFGWSSTLTLPERSLKYFSGTDYFPGSIEQYQKGCIDLAASVGHDPAEFIQVLADHMERVIDGQDSNIDFIVTDAPGNLTRDEVVVSAQTWPLAGSKDMAKAMDAAGFTPKNYFAAIEWVRKNVRLAAPIDPVPGWRRRLDSLSRHTNPHAALKAYRSFMEQTATLRDWIAKDAEALDREIQHQIDRMRGK